MRQREGHSTSYKSHTEMPHKIQHRHRTEKMKKLSSEIIHNQWGFQARSFTHFLIFASASRGKEVLGLTCQIVWRATGECHHSNSCDTFTAFKCKITLPTLYRTARKGDPFCADPPHHGGMYSMRRLFIHFSSSSSIFGVIKKAHHCSISSSPSPLISFG